MKNIYKFLCIFVLVLMVLTNNTQAAPYKADAQTKRIPAGTKLKFELIDPVNTYVAYEGYPFSAILKNEQKSAASVILPAGSVVRGNVRKLVPSKIFSRGAILYLDFDHVVTPSGRQLPLSLAIYNRNDMNFDGGIYGSKGYGEALKNNWAKTVAITKTAANWGSETGKDAFTGANYITTPICALGGAIGGGAYLIGDSIIDIFRKGEEVNLQKGTILDVTLTYPIDVPVN